MKNTKLIRCLAAMALAVTLYAGKSVAGSHDLAPGTFQLSIHQGGYCNNPNGFPVVAVNTYANPSWDILAGFLLDGSKSSEIWLKTLQDAIANGHQVRFYFDDAESHGFCGNWYAEGQGTSTTAYQITTMFIFP